MRLECLKKMLSTVDERDRWRVHELIGAAFYNLADPDGAAQAYFNAAQCDRYLRAQRQHYSNYLFNLHYLPHVDPADLAAEHFIYAELFRDVEPINPSRRRHKKIAVGYLAPHFHEGAALRFYEPLIKLYDRQKFTVQCFTPSDEEEIAAAGLDILFDLGGHSEGGVTLPIMARRLAPIQITGLGWIDTTGLKAIDYILTDEFLTPTGDEKFFTEKFWKVPHALVFSPTEKMRPSARSRRDRIVFGCFNNFMKITDEYLECAAEILDRVPNSRMIFQDTTRLESRRRRMIERAENFLSSDRIEVRLGRDDYLDDYADVDIMLDTFPYNGGAMTATALCMNVPVVSIAGDRYGARFGADILRAAGLDELIVEDKKNFIERAIDLSNEIPIDVIDRLKDSALLDTRRFVRAIEEKFIDAARFV